MKTKKLALIFLTLITSAIANAAVTINQYIGAWGSTATYAAGSVVTYNNQTYLALVAVSKNTLPNVNPSKWQLFGSNVTGPQGLPGLQGPAGAPGPAGAQGIQGVAGPAGRNGTNGTNGTNGAPGAQGLQGIQGVPGPAGAPGGTLVGNDYKMYDANNIFIGYHQEKKTTTVITNAGIDYYLSNVDMNGFHDEYPGNSNFYVYFTSTDCSGTGYYYYNPTNITFSNIVPSGLVAVLSQKLYALDQTKLIDASTVTINSSYQQGPLNIYDANLQLVTVPGICNSNPGVGPFGPPSSPYPGMIVQTNYFYTVNSLTLVKDLSGFIAPFHLTR